MISIAVASTADDFEVAGALSHALGAWDAVEAAAYGIPEDILLELFHSASASDLAATYSAQGSTLFIAYWNGKAAGSVGFSRFDKNTLELHKFYVDDEFRGKGIGRRLVETALAEGAKTGCRAIVLHTTIYMKNAISIYESFGFTRCPAFRPIPDVITHTEVFMTRLL